MRPDETVDDVRQEHAAAMAALRERIERRLHAAHLRETLARTPHEAAAYPDGVRALAELEEQIRRDADTPERREERAACKTIALRAATSAPSTATPTGNALWVANEIEKRNAAPSAERVVADALHAYESERSGG